MMLYGVKCLLSCCQYLLFLSLIVLCGVFFVVVKQICHFALLEVLNGNWRLALGYNRACLIVAYRVNELNYCSNDNEI